MSLQSQLDSTLGKVLESDGFGHSITVDDVHVVGVFSPPKKEPIGFDGLFLERRELYCKVTEIDAPITGQEMVIDGGRWTVGTVETWDSFFRAECTRYLS